MKALATLIGLGLLSGLSAQSPLSTFADWEQSYIGPGTGRTMYFDLTVNNQITIRAMDINCSPSVPAGTPGTIEFYLRTGGTTTTYLGGEQTPGDWTLQTTGAGVSNAINVPTPVCFAAPITLNPGIYAVAIQVTGFGQGWTLGTGTAIPGSGNQTFSNADLTMRCGAVQATLFTSVPINSVRFNGHIHYYLGLDAGLGCSALPAKNDDLGTLGCYSDRGSIYQEFYSSWVAATANQAASAAMTGKAVRFQPQAGPGSAYTVVPSLAAFSDPTLAAPPATTLNLSFLPDADDGEMSQTLATGLFTSPSGSWGALNVHTNGIISTGPIDASIAPSWVPFTPDLLAAPVEAWYTWHDYNPSAGGTVTHHFAGTVEYFTWNAVESYPAATVNPGTIQYQFDTATGTVDILWVSVAIPGVGGNNGSDIFINGYSPAGASLDFNAYPMTNPVFEVPLSSAVTEKVPFSLTVNNRVVLGANLTYTVSNETTPNLFGIMILSLQDLTGFGFPPPLGLDLDVVTPGCKLNANFIGAPILAGLLPPIVPSFSLFAPLDGSYVGIPWHAQAVLLDPSQNGFGVISTNYFRQEVGTW